jgi:hypothetical protein
MRKLLLAGAAALVLGGAAAAGWMGAAEAQSVPAAGDPPGPQMQGPQAGDGFGHPWMRWMMHRRMEVARTSGLFDPAVDRQLTGPDVQKIAEAFLLWHGNRSWKVSNVTENADDTVSFAFTAPDGTVIARFAIDKHNGHIRRLG